MIYAFKSGLTTIVAAASTLTEFEEFYEKIDQTNKTFDEHYATNLLDLISDDRFQGFKRPVYVFIHGSFAQQDQFVQDLELKGRNFCLARHAEMVSKPDEDERTIAEIHGLDQEDRWDRRSDEEKERDEELRKKMKDAQTRGDLSGDSFSPVQNDQHQVQITDIRGHHEASGNVVIDDVIAVKGFSEGAEIDTEAVARKAAEAQEAADALRALPRPWHEGSLSTLNETEKQELSKDYSADEFLMCGEYSPEFGTFATITPKTYFQQHKKLYTEPLGIDHLLPSDLKEIGPGVYRTRSRNWHDLNADLSHRGFVESLYLQIYLNNLNI